MSAWTKSRTDAEKVRPYDTVYDMYCDEFEDADMEEAKRERPNVK